MSTDAAAAAAAAANLEAATSTSSTSPQPLSPGTLETPSLGSSQRSHSLSSAERTTLTRQLQCIAEDPDNPPPAATATATATATAEKPAKPLTAAQAKRASLVKKAIRYFEDKSNRSVSEDNLFTRRKNLAVHLGLDENISRKEVQKINTYTLPVPSSATSFDIPDPTLAARDIIIVEENEDEEEEARSKDLVQFLGMRDDLSASIDASANSQVAAAAIAAAAAKSRAGTSPPTTTTTASPNGITAATTPRSAALSPASASASASASLSPASAASAASNDQQPDRNGGSAFKF